MENPPNALPVLVSKAPPAGFGIRFVAFVIDGFLLSIVGYLLSLAVLGVLFWIQKTLSFSELQYQFLKAVCNFGASALYRILGHSQWGTTIGKKLLRIRVIDFRSGQLPSIGQCILRELGYVISMGVFGLGFLMIAAHPEKRGLHEILSSTRSVRS